MAILCLQCHEIDSFSNKQCVYCPSTNYGYLCEDCECIVKGDSLCDDCLDKRRSKLDKADMKADVKADTIFKRISRPKYTGKHKIRHDKFFHEKQDKRRTQAVKDIKRDTKYKVGEV